MKFSPSPTPQSKLEPKKPFSEILQCLHTRLNSASMLSLVLKLALHLILMIHTRFQISILHSCHIISLAFLLSLLLSFLLAEGNPYYSCLVFVLLLYYFSRRKPSFPRWSNHFLICLRVWLLYLVFGRRNLRVMGWTTDTHTGRIPLVGRPTSSYHHFFFELHFCWDAWGCCSFSLFVATFHDLDDCERRYEVW